MTELSVFTIDDQDLYGTWHETPPATLKTLKSPKIRKSLEHNEQIDIHEPERVSSSSVRLRQGSFCRSAVCKSLVVLICATLVVIVYLLYKRHLYEPPPTNTPEE